MNFLKKSLRKVFEPKRKVHFVYSKRFANTGSSLMRGKQLSEIASKYAPKNFDIQYSPIDTGFRNCILVLTKGVIKEVTSEQLIQLKSDNNFLMFDVVDDPVPPQRVKYADVLLAASVTAYKDYRKKLPEIKSHLVNHHVDPRIKKIEFRHSFETATAAYFGLLQNTFISNRIKKEVDFFDIDTSKKQTQWIDNLNKYNVHYAIRKGVKENAHKPFLKGFTAAHCNSNILIQSNEKEAVEWLGEDYPFLIKGELNELNILEMLNFIRASFSKNDWVRGLEIMRHVKAKTSEESIGRQLKDLFEQNIRGLNE